MPPRPTPSIIDVERKYEIDSPDEREQRFRRVFDDGPMGIVLVGTDSRFLAVNRAFCEMLGYDESELLNRSFIDFTHPDEVEDSRFAALQATLDETGTVRYEKRYLTKGGEVVHALVSGWPIRDAAGLVTHSVGTIQDVTAQKTDRALADRLRMALEERDTLLREIHHRVKNNLQVVSSLLTLQLGQVEDPATRMLVQESQARITAIGLVHEMLCQDDDLANVDLGAYLTRVTHAVSQAYTPATNRIEVVVDVESIALDLDCAVRCGLIVNELASNAYKHAFAGESTGRITIRLSTRTPGTAALSVEDDGRGMPEDLELDRLETLGLQLVHHLSKQLGGKIDLVRDRGTRFVVSFPLPG